MSERRDPTDLELMLYADGELSGERRAAVEAFQARDARARGKLASLATVGDLVREADRESASHPPRKSVADAVMVAASEETRRAHRASRTRRAKQGVALVGAFAAAAAVLLALVPFGERRAKPTDDTRSVAARSPTPPASPAGPARASTLGSAVALIAPGNAVGELPSGTSSEHGVEVWSVDFGARSGAVFYVPSDGSTTETTTVVWLAQSDLEGSEVE